MRRVCIVGAGPSGLVAAKTLLHDHPNVFEVTIFEKSHRIGGLWPVSRKDDGMINPEMCTNQSRHTVSFSDWAWPEDTPQFPKAWQVGQYLESYRNAYLSPSSPGCQILTGIKVTQITGPPIEEQVPKRQASVPRPFEILILTQMVHSSTWKVEVQDEKTSKKTFHEFEHVIIASGFFGKPKLPQVPSNLEGNPNVTIIHSSELRDLKNITRKIVQGTKIVVVGGQMSGVETAASIAFQLSSAENSPGPKTLPTPYTVHNIVQRPFWVMPLFFPTDPTTNWGDDSANKVSNPSPSFLPLDLIMYNLDWRPAGPIQNNSGHITPEAANITNNFMNTYIGTDQTEIGDENLSMAGDIRSKQVWLACSDSYTEFVRSKRIVTHRGKLIGGRPNTVIVEDDGKEVAVEDVAAIVFATGFEAAPSFSFFDKQVLETLGYDRSSSKFPLALDVHSTVHRAIPSLGFVGFYRSPYWGVMEMQARFLGNLWTQDEQAIASMKEDDTRDKVVQLRTSDRLAQFPMGDYAYLMESFSKILRIPRIPSPILGSPNWIVLPQRYVADSKTSSPARAEIETTILDPQNTKTGGFLARAVFRALQGDWKVARSHISPEPSCRGEFNGTSKFLPRLPTDSEFDMEYLYVEEGKFRAEAGWETIAKKRYTHRYVEARDGSGPSKDVLSVWFVKPDDNITVDYHFHDLKFLPPKEQGQGWRAISSHWCTPDNYEVEYEFRFRGVSLETWKMEYTVKGPNKDYVLKSVFKR